MTKNALISVYHKDGITEFAKELTDLGWKIYASGGTAKHLSSAGILVEDVATLVGGGAILGHRVVTLSREIHAGLLSRDISEDIKELADLGIPRLDLVCVDLYPLETEIAKPDSTRESVVNQTDIGGPTMIRSAVKGGRIVICDPKDRMSVIEYLKKGETESDFVEKLGAKGEYVISKYTLASAKYLSGGVYDGITGREIAKCKYGENGYQTPSALFGSDTKDPLGLDQFEIVEGTPPSYNNYCDIDRLLQSMTHIAAAFAVNRKKTPFIAVGGKHGNCCGAAIGDDVKEVVEKMLAGDPLSIFGGLIMTNFPIDEVLGDTLSGRMLDGVIAPDFTPEAISKLRRKGDKCRFIKNPSLVSLNESTLDTTPRFRYVRGGFLKQPNYTFIPSLESEIMQKHLPADTSTEDDMLLAWAIGSTSNSNTITIVKGGQLLGNGVGQQDRVGAAKLAIERAVRSKHDTNGAAAYSDSFFPFPDGPQTLIDAGIHAIFSTSGSVRDNETIDLCKSKNVSLYMIPDSSGRGFFGH
ncbi:MAG: hypothetical protein WC761_05600 [Candidatus Paceibacterota bacterium]|jgi:phosphoribosylaminoimidazolecarboxamide formyltransferase/IMP cyclohydrolase